MYKIRCIVISLVFDFQFSKVNSLWLMVKECKVSTSKKWVDRTSFSAALFLSQAEFRSNIIQ